MDGYEDMSLDRDDYEGQTVLILGTLYELCCQKLCLWVFPPCQTQTRMCSHRKWLEPCYFWIGHWPVILSMQTKTKAMISLCSSEADLCFLARLHEVQKSYCCHHGRTRSRSRSTLLKFSRSLYLCNHSSESIHTWTIGTQ